jgi:CDP-diacylglycerol--glycerol-3-phosphate 3-phosphatidyltransferase
VNVPNALSLVRLLLVPVLLTLAWNGCSGTFFPLLLISMLTDAVDGFVARRFNQTTSLGAKLDSWADLSTQLALPFCGWWLRPEVVRQEAPFLATGIFVYLAAIAIGFLKFRRLTSYHTWGGKLSAIAVAAAVVVFFANGPGWPFRIAMPIVILACLEEIAITAVLPARRADVPSLWHALQIRRAPAQRSAAETLAP